jgi:hypothetical protein
VWGGQEEMLPRCGVVGHAGVENPVGHRRRESKHHGAEGASEGLLIPLPGPLGLG